MGIKIKDIAGIIGDYDDDNDEIRFCQHCEEHGFHNVLRKRIYPPDPITKKPVVTPPNDHNKWLMCWTCGTIVARYQTKVESKLESFVATDTNPHYMGKKVIGLDNKIRTFSPTQKVRKKQKERIEREKDPDIRKELRKGLQVDIIEEVMNY